MASYEQDITTAVAELLADEGVARWSPDGSYSRSSTDPAVFVRIAPEADYPVITLSTYPVAVAWNPTDSILGLQVTTRAPGRDPRATDALDDAIQHVLHGLSALRLGPHPVSKISYASGALLGQDGNERWIRAANYYIHGPR